MKIITTIHENKNINSLLLEADGFILGIKEFSKTLTKDFTNDLIQSINLCVENNKEVYILFNKLFTNFEINNLKKYIKDLPINLINGFIISDIGLIPLLQELGLENKIVYNPETMLTNYHDFNFFKDDNIFGAFVSKEITLNDIKMIGEKKAYKAFMFGHGNPTMFYSKREILTEFKNYTEENLDVRDNQNLRLREPRRKNEYFPVIEDSQGTHVFRGHVFSCLEDIKIIKENIDYLLIDTLFKDDLYGSKIINLFRLEDIDESKIEEIKKEYSEEWFNGFLHKQSVIKEEENND